MIVFKEKWREGGQVFIKTQYYYWIKIYNNPKGFGGNAKIKDHTQSKKS